MGKFTIEVTKLTQVSTNWYYKRIGQIDSYLKMDVIARYNDVGSWSLSLLDGTDQAALLQPGTGVVIWYEGLAGPLMSGPLRNIQRSWSESDSGEGTVTFSGFDDNCIFNEHVCMPDPANGLSGPDANGNGSHLQSVAYYGDGTTSQSLERLIYSLAYYNFGPGNAAGRGLKAITVPSQASWPGTSAYPKTTYHLRFESVLEALRTRTEAGTDSAGKSLPLGWRWCWDKDTETKKLSVYWPMSDPKAGKSVRFSQEIGNLKSYDYTLAAPKASWYLLGLDQATTDHPETQNLWIADKRSADDWNTNAEVFTEHTDVSLLKRDVNNAPIVGPDNKVIINTDAINTAIGEEDLAQSAIGSLTLEPIDTVGCKFGRDYWLGDLVTVVIDGSEITDVLREVHLTDDATSGPQILPTIGSPDASGTPKLYKDIRKIWDAVNRTKRIKQGSKFG